MSITNHYRITFVIAEHNFWVSSEPGSEALDGTTQATLALATRINSLIDYEVILLSSDKKQTRYLGDNFLTDNLDLSTTICVCPAMYQQTILNMEFKKLLVWIHHPHWRDFLPDEKINHYVYCGQYVSKLRPRSINKNKTCFIHNIQRNLSNLSDGTIKDTFPIDVIFIGALIKSKGIIQFLKNINQLASFQCIKVGIIGSTSLYSGDKIQSKIDHFHSDIRDTCQKLVDSIHRQGSSCSIYGSLGIERYTLMQQSKIIVVNPTGKSEALSTSILENYQLNNLTLSGYRNGNKELIHPENTYSMTNLKKWLSADNTTDRQRVLQLQKRTLERINRPEDITLKWKRLIEGLTTHDADALILPKLNLIEKMHNLKPLRTIQ